MKKKKLSYVQPEVHIIELTAPSSLLSRQSIRFNKHGIIDYEEPDDYIDYEDEGEL